jgi:acetylornithine deacetylase/succinyl-diaminopimelate desuccinylase-like protein
VTESGAQPCERGNAPDVAELCSALIQINTSNPTHVEAHAADLVAEILGRIGVSVTRFEPEHGRVSLVGRVEGEDPTLPPLLVHTHLDVVPAAAEDWTTDPFGGEIRDGFVWGRGAVDMKGMIAAVLTALQGLHADGRKPRRGLVVAFFADEEAGGRLGAGHVTTHHPELFTDCNEAIGEVGGFSYSLTPEHRAYLVSSAEKGVVWANLVARGNAGHASMLNADNAVVHLAEALTRVAHHQFDSRLTPAVSGFFSALRTLLEKPSADERSLLADIGPLARVIRASMSDTVNPTMLSAGYKSNVVPSSAEATIDGRFLPGNLDVFTKAIVEQAGDKVAVEQLYLADAVEAPWDTPLVAAIASSLRVHDPDAVVVPYMSTAFTDAKWLSRLGIDCYGFCPLQLPDELDFTSLFHGADERVPVAGLEFSVSVLRELFENY